MKKILLYTGLFLLTLGFTSCDEDFKDWADPQSNSQEEEIGAKTATFAPGKDVIVIVDTAVGDSVEIATVSSTTSEEGSEVVFSSVIVNEQYSLPFTGEKGVLRVAIEELDSVTQLAYLSRASVERELKLDLKATEKTASGEGLLLTSEEGVTIKLKPGATPEIDPNGYYIVGDITEWNATGAKAMVQDSENKDLYTFDIELTEGGKNFKIFPASAITTDVDWSKALGSKENEDDSSEGFIHWEEENEAGAIQIANGGKIRITFDAFNYRYTVKDTSAPDEIYMTGSAYDWGTTWKPFTPIHSEKGVFWSIAYFSANEEVKFAPQAGWGNDFGFAAKISQESIDLAGLSDEGGNIKVGNAGWYVVSVSVVGDDKVVEFYEPKVYLIGETAQGGWDAQLTENDLFVIPSGGDGEFVSPAFAATGELRLCVHPIDGIDWWKTEFIILDGSIEYRGNGDVQKGVKVTAGQKAYLNFKDDTGRIE